MAGAAEAGVKRRWRLSGWARIGIVLSVGWCLTYSVYSCEQQISSTEQFLTSQIIACTGRRGFAALKACIDETNERWKDWHVDWAFIMTYALGPVLLFWLTCWIVLRVFRWVARGFSQT
jgi:hypothetical protein